MHMQGSPEGTVQVQLTLLAKEALGQPELAATSDARLQAAFGQAGKGDIVQTGGSVNTLRQQQARHILSLSCRAGIYDHNTAAWRSRVSVCSYTLDGLPLTGRRLMNKFDAICH